MFCTNCGAEVEPGATFCANCGARIARQDDDEDVARAMASLGPDADQGAQGEADRTVYRPQPVATPRDAAGSTAQASPVLPRQGRDDRDGRSGGKGRRDAAIVVVVLLLAAAVVVALLSLVGMIPNPFGSGSDDSATVGEVASSSDDSSSSDESGSDAGDSGSSDEDTGTSDGASATTTHVGFEGITSARASSTLATDSISSYDADHVLDGDPATCWSEGVDGLGVGESITLSGDGVQTFSGFRLTNGYQKTSDLYYKNPRASSIDVLVDGELVMNISPMTDSYGTIEDYALPEPVDGTSITFVIEDAASGSAYTDTSISDIEVY